MESSRSEKFDEKGCQSIVAMKSSPACRHDDMKSAPVDKGLHDSSQPTLLFKSFSPLRIR